MYYVNKYWIECIIIITDNISTYVIYEIINDDDNDDDIARVSGMPDAVPITTICYNTETLVCSEVINSYAQNKFL